MNRLFCLAALMIVTPVSTALAGSGPLDGRWDASITLNRAEIPFRIDFSGDGPSFTATLFDGDLEVTSTSGSLDNGSLVASFGHYLTKLSATAKNDKIEGTVEGRFERDKYIASYPFRARRYIPSNSQVKNVPAIDGLWEIPFNSSKGEKAWRFIVRQQGPEARASILRVDGDTGTLSGSYRDGKWILSHFSGSRPHVLEVKPEPDGTLQIHPRGAYTAEIKLTAYRPARARAKGLPEPADFDAHTRVRQPNEPFQFSFPDLDGKIRSSNDPQFKGKVVVAVVTGTWCPNCHDEAQFLVKLHRKYRDRGLEIVALDFEEPEQQEDGLARAHAFIEKYGVEYTYLNAGSPVEMWEKVPQAVNLNSWPTTFFIGRDGLVKKVHAGFASPASGSFHDEVVQEFTSAVERWLADDATAAR